MIDYEQSIHINDETFDGMIYDADIVLQKLIKNMIEKESLQGKLTITIDVTLVREWIPNTNPKIEGETRPVYSPIFSHKVGSVMQIKQEVKGNKNYDNMELVWDEEKGEYVLKPVSKTDQMTIFDVDYRCVNDEEESSEFFNDSTEALEGKLVASLPGPIPEEVEEMSEEVSENEADGYTEAQEGNAEDLSEEYDYEEPQE